MALPTGVVSVVTVVAALTLFVFLVYQYVIHPAYLSPLAPVPKAHWSVPYSRLWILAVRFKKTENRTLHALHQRLGPVIRVAPYELSVDGADCVRTVYGGGFEKPIWYSVFDNYGVPCMFSARGPAEHSLRKRMISNVYSKSFVQTSQAVSEHAGIILLDRFLPTIRESTTLQHGPQKLDVHSFFLATTMDFVSSYVFGIENGTNFIQQTGYRAHWLELYQSRNDYGFYDQELPTLTRLARRLGIPLCPRFVDNANAELSQWCKDLCNSTLQSLSTPKCKTKADAVVMSALLARLEKERLTKGTSSILYPTALTHHSLSVASELFDHVLAGQETAGVTLTYLTWRLSQSLSLQAELRRELLSLDQNLAYPSPVLPDVKQLDSLPLLHAITMETLRLHAPIPGAQPRETPYPSCQLGGYTIPGGVRVAAMAYTLHRDEEVFPGPEQWDHTRWLPGYATEDERRARQRLFWAFGSGGRMCIGSNFAMHELKLIVAAIYSNFTSHIVDDEGVADQTDGYTSRPAKERLYLRFQLAD